MFVHTKNNLTKIFSLKTFNMVGENGTSSLSSFAFDKTEVIHNLKNGNIENNGKEIRVLLEGTHYAKILYEKNEQTYNLYHTELPDEYQGKGLGSIFAEKIFDYLITKNNSVKIKLTCEYLQHFCEKNGMKYKKYIEK